MWLDRRRRRRLAGGRGGFVVRVGAAMHDLVPPDGMSWPRFVFGRLVLRFLVLVGARRVDRGRAGRNAVRSCGVVARGIVGRRSAAGSTARLAVIVSAGDEPAVRLGAGGGRSVGVRVTAAAGRLVVAGWCSTGVSGRRRSSVEVGLVGRRRGGGGRGGAMVLTGLRTFRGGGRRARVALRGRRTAMRGRRRAVSRRMSARQSLNRQEGVKSSFERKERRRKRTAKIKSNSLTM